MCSPEYGAWLPYHPTNVRRSCCSHRHYDFKPVGLPSALLLLKLLLNHVTLRHQMAPNRILPLLTSHPTSLPTIPGIHLQLAEIVLFQVIKQSDLPSSAQIPLTETSEHLTLCAILPCVLLPNDGAKVAPAFTFQNPWLLPAEACSVFLFFLPINTGIASSYTHRHIPIVLHATLFPLAMPLTAIETPLTLYVDGIHTSTHSCALHPTNRL